MPDLEDTVEAKPYNNFQRGYDQGFAQGKEEGCAIGDARGYARAKNEAMAQVTAWIKSLSAVQIVDPTSFLNYPIEDLDLSERPSNCLRRAQIPTIGQLVGFSSNELLNITHFNTTCLDEVVAKLREHGLSLKG